MDDNDENCMRNIECIFQFYFFFRFNSIPFHISMWIVYVKFLSIRINMIRIVWRCNDDNDDDAGWR